MSLYYGRPILSTYYVDDEASLKYLERYPLAICVDQRKNMEDAILAMEEFICDKAGKTVQFAEVQNMYSKNTPADFVKLINEVLDINSVEEEAKR